MMVKIKVVLVLYTAVTTLGLKTKLAFVHRLNYLLLTQQVESSVVLVRVQSFKSLNSIAPLQMHDSWLLV